MIETKLLPSGKMLINDQWIEAPGGETIELVDPATGTKLTQVSAASEEMAHAAVAAARKSLDDGRWRSMPSAERGKILWRLADLIESNVERLANIEVLNVGMPKFMARGQILGAAETFRYYAGWCNKIHGRSTEVNSSMGPHMAYSIREPVGVVAAIVPWNAPLLMVAWKLAPALAAGCSTVLKPAESTPLSALVFGELALEAGVPPGVINVLPGLGSVAGAALSHHPDVDKLSFTGSTTVGRELVKASAGNMKRLTLELGGKSPFLIFDDADLDSAISSAQLAIFVNSGQNCAAGSRLIVHASVYDKVVEGVAAAAEAYQLGNGMDEGTTLGPVVSEKQFERVMQYIEAGRASGASLVTGGERKGDKGFFIKPTVFADVKGDMKIAREEIFGPVLAITRFEDEDEALRLANDTDYGLASYVWSENARRVHRLARRVRAGTVWVNTALVTDPSLPTGGFRQSGWGRENGPDGLEAYLENKTVISSL